MIITQTPFRMSFFGGGTDMESFFMEHGGAVLSTTFDKYCYVNVRHFLKTMFKVLIGLNASSLLVKNKTESTETKFKLKTNYDQYLRELLQLLTANKKYEIYIIPHVERDAGDELKKEFPNLHYLEPFDNPISAKSFISQMDIFIGARMHATIGAFSAGVATIPTAYSRKFKGLYESLGYKYVVDLAELNTHEAVELTVEYVKRYKELKLDVERCSINAEQRTALTYRILYEQLKEILA